MSKKNNYTGLLGIFITLVLPVIILTRFSEVDPFIIIPVALAFPFLYGLYELIQKKKVDLFSIIGIISVVLTGAVGLFANDPSWLAVKEATVPFVLGLAVLLSMSRKNSIAMILLGQAFDLDKIQKQIGKTAQYKRKVLEFNLTFASTFFLSAILNYVLARIIVVSQPGTTGFSEELGFMTALTFPVIVVPLVLLTGIALYRYVSFVSKAMKVDVEELLKK